MYFGDANCNYCKYFAHLFFFLYGDFLLNFVLPSLHQMTPLHLAAEGARINILEYLVDQKANTNLQDDNGVNICDHSYIPEY